MSAHREKRVTDGRDKFLMTAEALHENGGVTADAIVLASLNVLVSVLGDACLAADRLRDIADGLEEGPMGFDKVEGPIQ